MANIYRLKVDIKKTMSGVLPTFVQFDDARLEFQIFDDGKLFDLSNFTTVEFAHKKPNGQSVIADGSIEVDSKGNNIIAYDYQGSEMNVVGMVETTFSILDATQEKVSILPFKVNIVKDLRDEAVDPASQEYGKLQTYVAQLEALKIDMQNKIDESVTTTSNANDVIVLANTSISEMDTLKNETEIVKNDTLAIQEDAILATSMSVQTTEDTLLVKDQTIAVRDSTQAVQEATELVRQNTETERLSTETVRTNTEAERLATESVKDATQLVQDSTNIVRQDTLAEKNATEQVRLATVTVKDETEIVKNETILVKDEAAQVIIDTNIAKDNTIQAGLDATQATSDATQATSETIVATIGAQSIIDDTNYIGEFDIATAYKKNNIVGLDGSSYIAIQDTTGNLPTDNLNWRMLARKGIDGMGSVSSVNSVSPDENGNVVLEIASNWSEIQGKPDTFTPSAHSHEITDINGLTDALSGVESNAISSAVSTSNTYTDTQIAGLVESAPETLNTLNELASALGDDPNFATTVSNQIGTKVDKVAGKGLSTEDFTTEEKTKLANAATTSMLTPIEQSIEDHTNTQIHTTETHGIRVVAGEFEYFDGTTWQSAGGGEEASGVTIADTGNYYTATNVESAMQEIGQVLNGTRTSLIASANSLLGM